jgi:hypothetical protein
MVSNKLKRLVNQAGDTAFYQFDPNIGFWGVPNMEREVLFGSMRSDYISVRHNAEGNRDNPFEKERNGDAILCMGGSHTWGAGVEQELIYPRRLIDRTGRRVVNLGHCSLGLDQVCLALLQKSSSYSPSIVIIEQYPWSIHRILNTYVNGYVRPYFFLDSEQDIKLKKVPKLSRLKAMRSLIGSFHVYRKELHEYKVGIDLRNSYNPLTDPIFLYWKIYYYDYMYKLVDKILAVTRDYCRQKRIRLLFALGAIAQQFGPKSRSSLVDYDLPRKRLITLLEKNQIAFVDTAEVMFEHHTELNPVIFPDGHINAKGHDLFAEALDQKLHELAWLR